MKPNIRKCLVGYLDRFDGPFSVLMSGGLDSHAVLFSLLELRRKVHLYSFTLEDRESRDFRAARATAEALSLPFTPIYLSTNLDKLKKDIRFLVRDLGLSSKASIESLWGLCKAVDASKQKYVAAGLAAGLYFVDTKAGCIHFKDKTDEYRETKFAKAITSVGQTPTMKRYAKSVGKIWLSPWLSKPMLREFQGTTWDQINKPKHKYPLHVQFSKELEQVRVYAPQSLQLGDSGISSLFSNLLDDPEWNIFGYKSMSGIYNSVRRGDIK
jgi:hypothetical protein